MFCAKSAEVVERNGDNAFSLAKERAKRALEKAGGQAKECGLSKDWPSTLLAGKREWMDPSRLRVKKVTTNAKIYGE